MANNTTFKVPKLIYGLWVALGITLASCLTMYKLDLPFLAWVAEFVIVAIITVCLARTMGDQDADFIRVSKSRATLDVIVGIALLALLLVVHGMS